MMRDLIWGGSGLCRAAKSWQQILPHGCLPCVLRLKGAGSVAEEQDRTPGGHLVQPPLKAGQPPSHIQVSVGDAKQTKQEEPRLPPPPRPQALFFQTTPESLCCNGDSQTPASDRATSPLTSQSHILVSEIVCSKTFNQLPCY